MKKTLFVAIAGLMLAGTFSGVTAPDSKKMTISPSTQGSAPRPMCGPNDPRCNE